MKHCFLKKEIENMILKETKGFYLFNKKDMILKEEETNRVAAVQPTTNGNSSTASLNSDLNKAQKDNPNTNDFEVDSGDYDTKQTNDSVRINVNAKNTREATQEIQNLQKNPQLRNAMSNMDTKFRIHIGENVQNLREKSISFSKKELNEMFKKK